MVSRPQQVVKVLKRMPSQTNKKKVSNRKNAKALGIKFKVLIPPRVTNDEKIGFSSNYLAPIA